MKLINSKEKNPYFFMVSLPSSGSTLMAYILNSNSKVYVEHEDNARPIYLSNLYNLQWKISQGFQKYLNALLIQKEFLITSRYNHKKQIVLINRALGKKAKYIILTRSFMWRLFYRMKGLPFILPIKNLVRFFICKHYIINNFDYVKVKYNDMVSKPVETFLNVCKFIGVDFEPEMLNYQKFEYKTRGNPKVWKYKGIIDKSANESLNLNMVLSAIKFRLYLFKKKFLENLGHD